jgi:methyl-accepting chemotaxis protein
MEQVVSSIRRVTDIVAEIASASAEQSAGIEQVNRAVGDMDATTQHNAALVEQSAAAATSLQEQASRLAGTVSVFRLDGRAGAAAPAPAPASKPAAAAVPVPRLARASQAAAPKAAPQPRRAAAKAQRPAAAAAAGASASASAAAAASAGGDWEEF